jgi:hypothetical protein
MLRERPISVRRRVVVLGLLISVAELALLVAFVMLGLPELLIFSTHGR